MPNKSNRGERRRGKRVPPRADSAADRVCHTPESERRRPAACEQRLQDGPRGVPEHVAILGLGPSLERYVDIVKRMGARHAFADEVWAINAAADVVQCDRVFHMDDVRIQEIRANAAPESNIAAMLTWLRKHPGPVYTSRPHDEYPGLVAYPLADVVNTVGSNYFNNTAAYAVAFAVHIGVKKMSCFGMDFTWPNAHQAEQGRACVEYHLGIARTRGIKVSLPAGRNGTTLLDSIYLTPDGTPPIYGYDTLAIEFGENEDGRFTVKMTPRDTIPTAEEIERRYDHSQHPNALLRKEKP